MDEPVPHADDVAPRDLRMPFDKLRRQPACSLADDLNVPDHSVLEQGIAEEAGTPLAPHVAADARDGLEHVLDVRGIAGIGLSHSDAACASTALR